MFRNDRVGKLKKTSKNVSVHYCILTEFYFYLFASSLNMKLFLKFDFRHFIVFFLMSKKMRAKMKDLINYFFMFQC